MWPDSGAYTHLVNLPFRSMFYTSLIFPARMVGSLWPVVFFQSLVVVHLRHVTLRAVFEIESGAALVVITALLGTDNSDTLAVEAHGFMRPPGGVEGFSTK